MKQVALNPLYLTDLQVKGMVAHARGTSLGNHPTFGNYIADSLEQLHCIIEEDDPDAQLLAAEQLRDAAQAMIVRLEAGEVVA